MKRKTIITCIVIILLICVVVNADTLLTNLIESTNIVCKGKKFLTAEDALTAYEVEERKNNDTSLDYCPPYKLVYAFDYEENTIIFYSFCEDYDDEQSTDYGVRILKRNDDGTVSFESGFADFELNEPKGNENYHYFTNIETWEGKRSISFLYLPKDSNKEIYVDGIKAEKRLVSIEGSKFYICYAISDPDTFFSNWSTEISERHEIEIK